MSRYKTFLVEFKDLEARLNELENDWVAVGFFELHGRIGVVLSRKQ